MFICTFFGHRDASDDIEPILKKTIVNLIENFNVTEFLVGNNGNFDFLVISCLHNLVKQYPHIKVKIVLAYFPTTTCSFLFDTVYPEGMEICPKKYAISNRNLWMLNSADIVVSFVDKPCGGAAKFNSMAIKRNKCVINIAKLI